MTAVMFFDCHAIYGPHPGKFQEERWTLDHLLEDLNLAGISGALVQHHQAIHGDPLRANQTLLHDLAPYRDRLFPCWLAMPEGYGFPSPTEFVRMMKDEDIRAVRIEPHFFGLLPSEHRWCALRDALAELNALVLLSINRDHHDFQTLESFLHLFHNVNILLTGAAWQHWRVLEYLMETCPNLHLEFSAFQANRAVEYFSERFGTHRCLFGTGLLAKAPGAARGFFDWSLLPPSTVSQMTAHNLTRLLRGARPSSLPRPTPWQDSLTQAAAEGKPLPCEVWDNHCHILHEGASMPDIRLVFHKGDAEGMIEIIRRVGIRKTAIMSWEGPLSMDTALGNETVAKAVTQYPDAFLGLSTINPEHQSDSEIAAVIERYHRQLRFPGLKTLVAGQNINYDDPRFARWYEFGNLHRLYAVIDPCGRQDTEMLDRLCRRYPDLRISLDHCGQSWPYAKWAAEMVRRFPNVDAQLTYTNVTNGVIEYLVEQCGADRVLFGTDAPMRDPRPQVGWVVYARLMESQKRLILGENFRHILARIRWDP